MPSRADWLLRFIAGTDGYDGWTDRIRLMKGMFLFQEEGASLPELNYRFRPYDYGPFTAELYEDLGSLSATGFIATAPDAQSYRATQAGRDYLESRHFPAEQLRKLVEFRTEVSDLGFRALLKRVYSAHPEYASRSVAKDVLE